MTKLDIFIEKYKLDIDADTELNLTYRFSDLVNPTSITGDFSKTIKVKGTANNNEIFGQIWNLDRKIIFDTNTNTSISFNPVKRTNATIFINNEIFKSGYVKLNKITISKGVITYEITFYSDLCNLMNDLKDMKLINLNYPNKLQHTINRNAVIQMWNNTHPLSDYMTYIMSNSGMYENFESDKWVTYRDNVAVVEDIFNGVEFDELSKGEYRSYYQRPALKIDKLINQIIDDYNDTNTSDLSISLDTTFFNDENPYYAKSVLGLGRMNTELVVNSYIGERYDAYLRITGNSEYQNRNHDNFEYKENPANDLFNNTDNIAIQTIPRSVALNLEAEVIIKGRINYENKIDDLTNGTWMLVDSPFGDTITWGFTALYTNEGELQYKAFTGYSEADTNSVVGRTGNIVSPISSKTKLILSNIDNTGANFIIGTSLDVFSNYEPVNPSPTNDGYITQRPIRLFCPEDNFGSDLKIWPSCYIPEKIRCRVFKSGSIMGSDIYVPISNVSLEFRPITKVPAGKENESRYYIPEGTFTGNDLTITTSSRLKSDGVVSLSDILNDNETTAADFLINYSKIFGLLWDVNLYNKTVNITTKNNYFKDYKILDWSNKIDYSQTIDISPISFDRKTLSLSYNDAETRYEKHYKNRFDSNYGAQKINTGYEFDNNNTPEELISDMMFCNSIMSIENTKIAVTSGNDVTIQWLIDDKILPAFFEVEDGVRNQSDTKYNLLFDNGLVGSSKTLYVSDDYTGLLFGGDYPDNPVWTNQSYISNLSNFITAINSYPQFSTLDSTGTHSWTIGYPRENYARWQNYFFKDDSTIFNKYWQNYINEIYKADNKVMTCYILLTPNDMREFSFKNFIKINNTIWHVNEIIDYNPVSLKPTRVELMQVSNVEAIESVYMNGQKID